MHGSKIIPIAALALILCLPPFAPSFAAPAEKRRVEVVFVLDTTGSMANLIDGAKKKIWSIANAIIDKNPDASVRFGLVGYRDLGDEYVTKTFPLTDDVQSMYAALLEFQADGGRDEPESVNEALDIAVTRLHWSDAADVTADRILFLVGDAPPHMDYPQDRKFPEVIADAVNRGIIVNTVQAGDSRSTESFWREMAQMGHGDYLAIPQDGGRVVVIVTPYDEEISRIQIELNKTVIPYGSRVQQAEVIGKTSMFAAAPMESAAEMSRFVNKESAGAAVVTGAGDLVADLATPGNAITLDSLKAEDLPPVMQEMSPEERAAYIAGQTAKRAELAARMAEQNALRDAYIAEETTKAPAEPADSFDTAVRVTLERQMK